MQRKKKFLGLLCLALVALMTVVAYLIPNDAQAADDSVTQTIRVVVYSQYPTISFTSPEADDINISPKIDVEFSYGSTEYVDFTLSYVDKTTGETVEIPLPRFNPEELDSSFHYASGVDGFTLDLASFIDEYFEDDDKYNYYTLNAKSYSSVGFSEDSVGFYYAPALATQTGAEDETNDPIVEIKNDAGVAKIEVMVTDENGKELFKEPIIVEIDEPYAAGTTTITLPFGSYGLESGDYKIVLTSYKAVEDEDGEIEYVAYTTPIDTFDVTYKQPDAPEVPDTGRFLGSLNIAASDYVITGIIAFVGVTFIAYAIIGRKKKDYRKNYRNRR